MRKALVPLCLTALLLTACNTSTNPFSGMHNVLIKTSLGNILVQLDGDAAPKTVENFLTHVQNGYYNNLKFHRVIPEFMIQGGDPEGNGTGGVSIWGEDFADEISAKSYGLDKTMLKDVTDEELPAEMQNMTVEDYYKAQGYVFDNKLDSLPMERGALAMANRGANTNGSQFFIIQRADGTPWLNGKHTVFGKVVEGMDIVDRIANTPRDDSDNPTTPVTYTMEIVK